MGIAKSVLTIPMYDRLEDDGKQKPNLVNHKHLRMSQHFCRWAR